MQSDKYGKIEDMVIALRMVTPSGTIVTRTVPNSSNGIDVRRLCVGSEGILGGSPLHHAGAPVAGVQGV